MTQDSRAGHGLTHEAAVSPYPHQLPLRLPMSYHRGRMPDLTDLVPLPALWERMERVESRLLEVTESDHGQLTEIAQHLLVAGGKRYRPLLALLASEFGPSNDDRPIEAAVAVELIHVGSLYHDDVIDEADTRRGAVSANTNWTNSDLKSITCWTTHLSASFPARSQATFLRSLPSSAW